MEIGAVQHVDIDEQMRAAYLDYAMSVIVARASPGCPGWLETGPPANPLCHARYGDSGQHSL